MYSKLKVNTYLFWVSTAGIEWALELEHGSVRRIETFNNDVVRERLDRDLVCKEFGVEFPASVGFGHWTIGIIFHAVDLFVKEFCSKRAQGTSDMNLCKIDIVRVPASFNMQIFVGTGGEFIRISPTLQFERTASLLEVDFLTIDLSGDHEGKVLGAGNDGEGSGVGDLEHLLYWICLTCNYN